MRKTVVCCVVLFFCSQFQEIVALEAGTPTQTEYKELYDVLQWVFEKGTPMYYAGFVGDEDEKERTLDDEISEKYAKENPGYYAGMSRRLYTEEGPELLYFYRGITASLSSNRDWVGIYMIEGHSFVMDI